MWNEFIGDVETWLAKVKAEATLKINLVLSFFKEAITEEEAALWPQFQALATQIFGDEVKMAGLNLDARVAVVVDDFCAQLPADIALAKNALINSWAWAVAHQQGLTNGNQGILPSGEQTGG